MFSVNYLGSEQSTFTLNFSRGASQVLGQYYQLIRLGKRGFRNIMTNLTMTSDYLAHTLEQMGFILMSQGNGKGLPLVAFRLNPAKGHKFDEFAIAHQLRERGWIVPAYTMAPKSDKLKMMRVVVREDFSRSRCDALVKDIKMAVDALSKLNPESLKQQETIMKEKTHSKKHGNGNHKINKHYAEEPHSLQGKTGKTHAVC